jgi:outer membrane protein assembly factor BamE
MQKLLIPLFFLANSILLSGCANWEFPWVYRLQVDQGNIITQEKVNQLKPGMTREQVKFVMGSPLLTDTFHSDRWDYIYSLRDADGNISKQRLSVIFADDKLARLSGTFMPQRSPAVTPAPAPAADTTTAEPAVN